MIKKRNIPNQRSAFCESMECRTLFTTIAFAPHVDFVTGTSPVALVAADFNGDGNEDLAVADKSTDKVSLFYGNGAGGFSAGPVLLLGAPPVSMITGDFNGDGKPDLAVGSSPAANQSTTTVTVFLNTGADTFGLGQITTLETDAVANETVGLAASDFNLDGHLDLAVANYADETISILLGNGSGTFAAPVNYQSDTHPTAIIEADFNDDTYPDLAVTSTLSDLSSGTISNQVSLLLGSSTGDFTAGPNIAIGTGGVPDAVTAANLTVSTTPGLIVTSTGGGATLFTNTDGTFAESATAKLAAGSTAVAVGDFDLDGNVDLVSADGGTSAATSTNSVSIAPGIGAGAIAAVSSFATGAQPVAVVVADFNNDGKPDIATANENAGTVSILLNTTVIPLVSTKIAVAADNASTPAGSTVTLTATITPSGVSPLVGESLPTGTVNFYDGSTLLGSSTVVSGTDQAVYATQGLTIGAHRLKAIYLADTAYAGSTSAVIAETITPTSTDGPDLVGTFVSSTFPSVVAPGEIGSVTLRVTNQGNTVAAGTITNAVYLSLDNLLDSGDALATARGSLAKTRVNLKPGQSTLITGTLTIPNDTALASYLLVAQLNLTGSLAESISTNNLVVSPTGYQVSDVFGTVGGRKAIALSVTDNDGTPGIFKLTGPGSAVLNIGDAGIDLVLDGTTAATTLSITTKGDHFDLHEITADSAMGSIRAASANVSSAIVLPAGVASSVILGTVGDATLTAAGGIKSLSVQGWGNGQVTADWIGTLKSTQGFEAGLALSGIGAPGVTLNAAMVGGTLGYGSNSWAIAGNINKITAFAFAPDWSLAAGVLKSIASSSSFAGNINASVIGTILVRGDLTDSNIAASQSIGTLRVSGQVSDATINGGGSIHAITIGKTADSATRFIATLLPKRVVIDGIAVDPLTDTRFEV